MVRTRLRLARLAVLVLVLAACTPAALPPSSTGPAASSKTPAPSDWQTTVAAAKREGSVVMTGSPNQAFRQAITQAFADRFGIELEYLPINQNEAAERIRREAAAGKISIDVYMCGGTALTTLLPDRLLDPLEPVLLLPEVTDPSKWADGKLKWMDAADRSMLQTSDSVSILLYRHPQAPSITSWKDLLQSSFKKKIASLDPRRSGSGQSTAAYLLTVLGEQFGRDFYVGQEVTFSADGRQVAEWVARGVHQYGIGISERDVLQFQQLGLEIVPVFPQDGLGYISGGFSVISLVKNRLHPHAGVVLANWLASQEAQQLYERHIGQASRRTDARDAAVSDLSRPKPGTTYLDAYERSYYLEARPKAEQTLTTLLSVSRDQGPVAAASSGCAAAA
jgi:iron(III) transport system substrate-binding protein